MSDEEAKVTIKASHIHKLTGKSERQCQRILVDIRQHVKKTKKQPVTYFDVADFFVMPPEEVRKRIF